MPANYLYVLTVYVFFRILVEVQKNRSNWYRDRPVWRPIVHWGLNNFIRFELKCVVPPSYKKNLKKALS